MALSQLKECLLVVESHTNFGRSENALPLEVGKIDEGHCSTGIVAIRSWNFAAVMAQLGGCGVTAELKGSSVF